MGSSWNSNDSKEGAQELPWTAGLSCDEHRCSPFPLRALVPVTAVCLGLFTVGKYRAAAWKLVRWRQSTPRGFFRSRNTEGTTGRNAAGHTDTTISMSMPATSIANQIASSHSSGTSEKTV